MRATDDKGTTYLPYTFDGEWTEEERAEVEAAIRPHVPERVIATFNNWAFFTAGNGYFGRRATWDMGNLHGATAAELAEKIRGYYERRD